MTVEVERALATLSPMWQRIAKGEVDLARYSDEEILTGRITMADGRLLPTPHVLPDIFLQEQVRRGMRKAERLVRKGALESFDVVYDILTDDTAEDRDRLNAAKMFQDRFLGKADQRVSVRVESDEDPRELLLARLLAARQGLPPGGDEVVDAEVVDDDLVLAELL